MSYGDVKIASNSRFLKIEAGTPHDIRLLDADPLEVYEHPIADAKPVPCSRSESCALCAGGEVSNQKFLINVYDHDLGRVLLWKYGKTVATKLKAIFNSLREEGGDIMNVDLKVEATGSHLQKKYDVTLRVNTKSVPTVLKKHDRQELPF